MYVHPWIKYILYTNIQRDRKKTHTIKYAEGSHSTKSEKVRWGKSKSIVKAFEKLWGDWKTQPIKESCYSCSSTVGAYLISYLFIYCILHIVYVLFIVTSAQWIKCMCKFKMTHYACWKAHTQEKFWFFKLNQFFYSLESWTSCCPSCCCLQWYR